MPICHSSWAMPFDPSGPSPPPKSPVQRPRKRQRLGSGIELQRWWSARSPLVGKGSTRGGAGQFVVLGSILPRVDSVARPAEVIVEYDDLATLPPDVNKLPHS